MTHHMGVLSVNIQDILSRLRFSESFFAPLLQPGGGDRLSNQSSLLCGEVAPLTVLHQLRGSGTRLDSLVLLWFTNSGHRFAYSRDLTYLRLDDFTLMTVLCVVLGYRMVQSGGWLQIFVSEICSASSLRVK